MLRALKNLDSMSLEEPVSTLKVHEQEIQRDEGLQREKSLALGSQKNKKTSSSREHALRSSSKVLKVEMIHLKKTQMKMSSPLSL